MYEMILEVQKQKMLEMRTFLDSFCGLINNRMENLKDKLDQNVREGFPSDIAGYYEQAYYTPEKQEIDHLIQIIQTAHYSYIDEVVADIQQAINRQ